MTTLVSLSVSDKPIGLEYFMQSFIHETVAGMLRGLHGTGEIQTLELSISEDGQVLINLNNAMVPVNEFVGKIIRSTVFGMVSVLKGVGRLDSLRITIKR